MEVNTMLANSIAAAGDKANYDAACKRLLANKIILAWPMKSCLKEYRDLDVDEIAENYIEGEPQISGKAVKPDERKNNADRQIRGADTVDSTIYEGTITFDIRLSNVDFTIVVG